MQLSVNESIEKKLITCDFVSPLNKDIYYAFLKETKYKLHKYI